MKIAYDHQAFCMQAYGGISRYHVCLAQHLDQLDEQVQVFAPVHRNRYLAELPAALVKGRAVKRYRIPGSRLMLHFNASMARRQIARWQPELVHETYYAAKPMTPSGCLSVLTVHDMTHELFPSHVRTKDNTSQLKRLAVDRADHIICVSESTRADLVRLFGVAPEKTTVVHLGVQPLVALADLSAELTPVLDPTLESRAQSSLKGDSRPFVLFVGRRGGYKNFTAVLQAFAASKRLASDFDIVLFGGSSLRARERAQIQRAGFTASQVRHVAGTDAVLTRLYQQANLLVYPSLYEGFGLPPLEAMALGCPVVSSRISSMPEVLGEAAEYFESGSVIGLQSAMEAVLYSSSRAQALRQLGITRAAQFTWPACAAGTLAVYRNALNKF